MQLRQASRMTDHPCSEIPRQGGQAVASSGGLLPRHFQAVLAPSASCPHQFQAKACLVIVVTYVSGVPAPARALPQGMCSSYGCCATVGLTPVTHGAANSANAGITSTLSVSLLAPCSGPGAQWLLKKQPVRPQQWRNAVSPASLARPGPRTSPQPQPAGTTAEATQGRVGPEA